MRLLLIALLFPILASAQNPPAPPKKIPIAGITLTDRERSELTAGAVVLRAEIDALTKEVANDPKRTALLPDVEVFHKAVAWSLADDTFYSAREIAFAKHLLEVGRERAQQLRANQTPWLTATGLVLRGYRSKLDGSVQPYGLVVPEAAARAPGEIPLMVWLLGRGEKRTELAFLAEREAGPPPVQPKDVLTLIPYGRFCNATKFAGEVDVFEALAAVRAQYRIDANRLAVAGFSMGGGSTWHLATHYSGLWAVAHAGAGFAETPLFTRALSPNREPRPAWEQLLWRQYEATGVSGNLFNHPMIAYAGEIDGQKEASDLMEAAMAKEGLKLERFIGPQTAHRYHDETKAALTKRIEEQLAKGRDPLPREVRLQTYTLRYPSAAWVTILGMEKHWERAEVLAKRGDDRTILTTRNVSQLALAASPTNLTIDGQELQTVDSRLGRTLKKRDGKWAIDGAADSGLRKAPGLTGPVDDAFVEPFLFVRPSGRPLNATVGTWVESELTAAVHLWRDVFRGDAPVKSDTDVNTDDIRDRNLILWGDPSSNKVLAKLVAEGKLPLTWDGKALTFRGQTYDATNHAPVLIFPNPLNPSRYVVLNSGIDFRNEGYGNNAHQTPKLPDWAIVDLRTPPGPRWPGKIVEAGFFDENWK